MAWPFRPTLPGRGALTGGVRWLNTQPSLGALVAAMREALPGDSRFGDPLSTAGLEPAQILAKRAYSASSGPWSVLAEIGLAALQLADWLGPDRHDTGPDGGCALLFTDLVGYSSWAVGAGDEESLELLRRVDAHVTIAVEDAGGAVVKRLGDGTMAVFPDAESALRGAIAALRLGRRDRQDGYRPRLRAGVHYGAPQPIGGDFIGVDVNIAARLCEAAEPNEVLISGALAERLDGQHALNPRRPRDLAGVPNAVDLYGLRVPQRPAKSAVT